MPLTFLHRLRDRTLHSPQPSLPRGAGALDLCVNDPVGLPMAGVEISVLDSGGREVTQGRTDPNGRLTVTLPPGGYRLVVTSDGFSPVRCEAEVMAGERTVQRPVTLELAPAVPLPAPGQWRIDPDHSAIRFAARHIGLADIYGRFNTFEGGLWIGERMQDSRVEVTIDAASLDTGVRMRDEHLRSAEFLDVARFPYLQFAGDKFVHKGGSRWAVQGVLHLHGVSRNVQLDTRYLGIGTGMAGETRTACRAVTELHREDFTLDWRKMLARGIAAIGATIRIDLDIQAVRPE
ncbi:YceI family protein [Streptomyces pinistramenti]|uniref:YceI family protein n=1 Tax=Streptomyces pinistramenti TaxID=2884812 RepID=UPI001D06E7F6|nr:YceI family protein [Streptomyces pinistramenti]MCB5906340.1 YceI family protein [Streptomyces pinistramenti]